MFNSTFLLYTLGSVLNKIALLLLLPLATALLTNGAGLSEFAQAFILIFSVGFLFTLKKPERMQLRVRDMLLLTVLIWFTISLFGALPFIFIKHISLSDAYFETMSGLTTTGSSVLSNLSEIAPSLLMWRAMLQWIGGLGVIVMAVAILPFLNAGGMTLFRAESSDWSEKSMPHTKDIAKNIVQFYLILTALCIVAYMLTGMNLYDAINHTFTTISTGGFSSRDGGMSEFSATTQWVCTVFMFLGSVPFLLYVQAAHKKRLSVLLRDQQVRGFFAFVMVVGLAMAAVLYFNHTYNLHDSIRISLFTLVNIMSTTGYTLVDFDTWTSTTTLVFAFAFLLGGCSGSTAGGIKIFRFQIIFTLLKREIKKLIHPNSIHPIQFNRKKVSDDTLLGIIVFIFCFCGSIVVLSILLSLTGMAPLDALSSAMTSLGNVGPGLGPNVGPSGNFADVSDISKWLMSFGMLLGRLEIMTLLVLLFPSYWRK
ncbi:TrkH family potassium uptake protein [Pasteurellaceae bacterium HPA106]|uniref:TrkH family potassium uptake protein n=1 Tax=Spirabiliibacterium pneumoniae TaxID=221400 RepID=UPI001AAD3D5F|nr:TrkH family potassium uptake protein [Spirabiliibacterium pneumoniae]MBE2896998.1 TrkH family potassium uptake protein [Spirabiliibacterium pneumoniae]